MCGRFTVLTWDETAQVARELQMDSPIYPHAPWPATPIDRNDAFPGSRANIIVDRGGQTLVPEELTWGFELPESGKLVFNTRSETASTSRMWSEAYREGRCIVPAFSFYEPHRSETAALPSGRRGKQLYRLTVPNGLILMAGLCQAGRFSILTCEPDEVVGTIHDRMPLLLSRASALEWMAGDEALSCRADEHLDAHALYPESTGGQTQLGLF
ncbi:MAG: SOS response-associated peptidase [Coriobacteriales bacterium]|jgi:putative SOS response-associated peptidase YedK